MKWSIIIINNMNDNEKKKINFNYVDDDDKFNSTTHTTITMVFNNLTI